MHNELFLCVEVCFSIPNKICCLLNELFDSSINRDLYFCNVLTVKCSILSCTVAVLVLSVITK
jgi:hypothetical protein